MARPTLDSRLQKIDKMEEKIESDIAEMRETVTKIENGNNGDRNSADLTETEVVSVPDNLAETVHFETGESATTVLKSFPGPCD